MNPKNVGRDRKGRYAKGNKGGPGRPTRVVETTYLETLRGNLTQERWAEVCCKVVELAEGGDLRAFDILCKYTLPTPEQRLLIEEKAAKSELRFSGKSRNQVIAEILDGYSRALALHVPEHKARLKAAGLLREDASGNLTTWWGQLAEEEHRKLEAQNATPSPYRHKEDND